MLQIDKLVWQVKHSESNCNDKAVAELEEARHENSRLKNSLEEAHDQITKMQTEIHDCELGALAREQEILKVRHTGTPLHPVELSHSHTVTLSRCRADFRL